MNSKQTKQFLFLERIFSILIIGILFRLSFVSINLWIMRSDVINTSVLGMSDLFTCLVSILVMVLWKLFSDKIFNNINYTVFIKFLIDLFMLFIFFIGYKLPIVFLVYMSSIDTLFNMFSYNSYTRITYKVFENSSKELEKFSNDCTLVSYIGSLISSLFIIFIKIDLDSSIILYFIVESLDKVDTLFLMYLYKNNDEGDNKHVDSKI